LSLDRFTDSFIVRDNWKELNLRQLDVTMGQKGMQAELRRRFGVDGGYTNTDLRRTTSRGAHPHVQATFEHLPFKNDSFNVILFDPPFLIDRRSLSGHDYRCRYFQHYTVPINNSGHAAPIGEVYGLWVSRGQLRKQLYRAFTELKRILAPEGRIIFKWTDSDASIKYALSLKNGLMVEKTLTRHSGYRLKATATTYYVWLKKPVIRGGE
jgi:hypothetical protein